VSSDFYTTSIAPYAPIIIKICRAYTNTQADFEDYYQEVCLQIWRGHRSFDERAAWSTWIYRVSLNVCMTLLKTQKRKPLLSSAGLPYTGAILCVSWSGLVFVRRLLIAKFVAPDSTLGSYHYLKAFQTWLKNRMARSRSLQRHLYPITSLALAIGLVASQRGQGFIHAIVEHNPDTWLINGVPLAIIVVVAVVTIVLELLGGVIFDRDIRMYRPVFSKLDEMVSEMEELRAEAFLSPKS